MATNRDLSRFAKSFWRVSVMRLGEQGEVSEVHWLCDTGTELRQFALGNAGERGKFQRFHRFFGIVGLNSGDQCF